MNTPFRSLASPLAVVSALVAVSSPTVAQRSQAPRGPTAPGGSLEEDVWCSPRFVGQQLVPGGQPRDVAIADLDRDGDLDVALASFQPGSISTVLNHRGVFEPGATYPVSGRAIRLVAGDVDGNGSPDLVACLLDTPTPNPVVAVLRNQGGGVFAAPVEYATTASGAGGPFSVALADLDGDGYRDLAVANNYWRFTTTGDVLVDTTFALLMNQGNGTFGPPSEAPLGPPDTSPGSMPEESSVVAGDLDGDGDADLALTDGSQNSLHVLANLGAGVFGAPTTYGIGSQPGALVAADLDGDGKPDLAIAQYQTDAFAVLLNQGGATFAPPQSYAGKRDAYSVTCADLDGDGARDLAFTTSEHPLALAVVLNQGNGAFHPPLDVVGHGHPLGLASGDLDGNGTIDLASVNLTTVSFFENLGNGTPETAPSYGAGASPKLVTHGDLDGDGDRDLVVSSGTLTKVSVLGNLGSGAFAPRVEHTVGARPDALALADLDLDGLLDLVTAGVTKANVRLNQGGTLGPMATFGIGPRPNGITGADLDDDGDVDLAMSLGSENTLGILSGLGDGTLRPVVTFPSGFDAVGITGGDFDRDGDVDLALVDASTGTARVFDNQGAGTFASAASYPAGANPLAIASADFNRDGRIDLAVLLERASGQDQAHAGVLLNHGAGLFAPSLLFPVGQAPFAIQSADLDLDGSSDLVVVANGSRALSLLLSRGDGTFASDLQVTAGVDPVGVTCADLDGDGDVDLASTTPSSGTVEIHLNHCR
jgi:VCBS repeat protein